MKTKQLSPEKLAKKQLRKEKELKYWEKQKARPKGNTYFWYLVLIIALIYAVDEIASQIGTLMQTEIANDFFQSESAVTLLNLLQIIAIPFQVIGIIYRPLADRFGRKTFLIIITFVLIIIEIALMVITVFKKHKKKFLGIVSCFILSITFLWWTYIDFFGDKYSVKLFLVIISIICLVVYEFNPKKSDLDAT